MKTYYAIYENKKSKEYGINMNDVQSYIDYEQKGAKIKIGKNEKRGK